MKITIKEYAETMNEIMRNIEIIQPLEIEYANDIEHQSAQARLDENLITDLIDKKSACSAVVSTLNQQNQTFNSLYDRQMVIYQQKQKLFGLKMTELQIEAFMHSYIEADLNYYVKESLVNVLALRILKEKKILTNPLGYKQAEDLLKKITTSDATASMIASQNIFIHNTENNTSVKTTNIQAQKKLLESINSYPRRF